MKFHGPCCSQSHHSRGITFNGAVVIKRRCSARLSLRSGYHVCVSNKKGPSLRLSQLINNQMLVASSRSDVRESQGVCHHKWSVLFVNGEFVRADWRLGETQTLLTIMDGFVLLFGRVVLVCGASGNRESAMRQD